MTRADVIASLARAGMFSGNWQLDDDAYDPISAAFVGQAWDAWVGSLPVVLVKAFDIGGGKSILVPNYQPEAFDCDNIANQFAAFLDLCMARDAVISRRPRGNSASGRFNYQKDANPLTGHSRVWFIDYAGLANVFEPGDRSFPTLSQLELPTITFGESV